MSEDPGHDREGFVKRWTREAPCRSYVYLACALASIGLCYIFGKETAFDSLHYHFYAGFSALNDRFDLDYFAAGAQAYFNPYAYIPFYALVKLNLPAFVVSAVLAFLQSGILWITYELACAVYEDHERKERFLFALCATLMAFMNPLFLQQLGTSFVDVTTGELVLAGWLLITLSVIRPTHWRVALAACLLGCATALKTTNALHTLSGLIVLAYLPTTPRSRLKYFSSFCLFSAVAFAVVSAPWSIQLARRFGNPVFPLMNGIFRSPEATSQSLKHFRFVPDSLSGALKRPFDMLDTAPMIHDELSAPDLRYAMLVLALAVAVISYLWNRLTSNRSLFRSRPVKIRALFALGSGFTVDWILWLTGSGNSRYFIPMASVASIVALGLLFDLLKAHKAGRNGIMAALLVAQSILLFQGTQFRSSAAPWGGRWFDVSMPQKLALEPNLYLSIGLQSNSFIVPYLAPGSGFVNFAGVVALGPGGANAAHVQNLIGHSKSNIRVILSGKTVYPDSERRDPRQSDTDGALQMFGLRVDMQGCETILVRGIPQLTQRPIESPIPAPGTPAPNQRYLGYLASCHVMPDMRDHSADIEARTRADIALNRLEDACPNLFISSRSQTEHEGQAWLRRYPQTDLQAWISDGQVKFMDMVRGTHKILVGTETDWLSGVQRLSCGRNHNAYYADVLTK